MAPGDIPTGSVADLLHSEGLSPPPSVVLPEPDGCDVLAWAASGAMALTGRPGQAPRWPAGPVIHRVNELAATVRAYSPESLPSSALDPGVLLTGRAADRGLRRQGQVSAGGHCRLLRASDGWVAASLPRPDDLELVPAVVGGGPTADPWRALEVYGATVPGEEMVARLRLLGLAAGVLGESRSGGEPGTGRPALLARRHGDRRSAAVPRPLVVDLSAMWAGPLCAHLLGLCGARVVKVEDPNRPDGARQGDRRLFDRLHAGHGAVALDLTDERGRDHLRALLDVADIVVESSRPRALRQLGVDAEDHVGRGTGRTWVSITGYGRHEETGNWIAFGDDAAVAGGLVAGEGDEPVFCGDAIADPLTGLVAAVGALASQAAGGGHLIDVSMAASAAFAMTGPRCRAPHSVQQARDGWVVSHEATTVAVEDPRSLQPAGSGPALGADTTRVLDWLAVGAPV